MIVGLLAVVVGMAMKGAPPEVLLNPAAVLIIFVGTFGALLNAFPMAIIKKMPSYFKLLIKKPKLMHAEELVKIMVALPRRPA